MNPARELPKLLERDRQLARCAAEQFLCRGRVGSELGLDEAQADGQRDEALLGAVVQVALEAPPRFVARRDESRPRGTKLFFVTLPFRDVEPARDDAHDVARVVADRCAAPGDHATLAASVRED